MGHHPTSPRRLGAAVAAGALALTGLSASAAAGATSSTTLAAVADSYVHATNKTSNYGKSTSLYVDGSPFMRTYVRFDVPVREAGSRTQLQVRATRSTERFDVRRAADTAWAESAITYANAPALTTTSVTSGTVVKDSWVTIDVTSLIPASQSGPVTLALIPRSGTAQTVASRETGATAPRLVVSPATTSAPAPDTQAPAVSLTSPQDGATYAAATSVPVTAQVSDNVGVTRVEFFDNGVYQGTEDTAPFAYTWSVSSATNGTHRWTARAHDAAGNTTTSAAITTTVNVPASSTVTTKTAPTASVETTPVPHSGDAADDAAVWIHPTDPSKSTVIGTDKLGGLAVYDLAGKQLHYYAGNTTNNVDLRYNVPLGNGTATIVVASDPATDSLRIYRVNPDTRGLENVAAREIPVGIGVYGLCMYRSPADGKTYVFDSDSSGTLQQWEIFDNGAGKVDARKVRQFSAGSTTEGCVADDETGRLYVAEEDVAIWSYGAEPSSGTARTVVDRVGAGHLVADIEGLSLYYGSQGDGYLLASSQGSNSFAAYDRKAPHTPATSFTVGAGVVDAVTYTDGIDVTNAPLGPAFPQGMFVAMDDRNDGGNQNYKLVPWQSVAASSATPLLIDTRHDPRKVGSSSSSTTAVTSPTTGSTTTETTTATASTTAGATSEASAAVAGTAYYVDSVGGSDANNGTSSSTAWKSLAKANSAVLKPGDGILLKSGGRWSGHLSPQGSGTAELPVSVRSYGTGAAPVITGSSTCVRIAGSHVLVESLEIRGCTWAGLSLSGSHNVVRDNYITDNAGGVYVKAGAGHNRVLKNQIIDNNRMSVLTQTPTSDDSGAFGVLLHGDDNEIANNRIEGSDAFSYDYGRDGAAVEVYGGQRNHVHHNVAADNDAFSELGNSRSRDNVFAYNVVTSSLPTSTFVVTRGAKSGYGPVVGTALYNNTVYFTGAQSQGFVCHAGCGPDILRMRNNIVQAVAKAGYADASFDEDYNLYWGGARQFTLGTHSKTASPGMADPASGDFTLRADSPAVDAGIDLGYTADAAGLAVPYRLQGGAAGRPDLGAFERTS